MQRMMIKNEPRERAGSKVVRQGERENPVWVSRREQRESIED